MLGQAIVRVLEELAKDGKIAEKVYGKQKVYVADQVSYRNKHKQIFAIRSSGPYDPVSGPTHLYFVSSRERL